MLTLALLAALLAAPTTHDTHSPLHHQPRSGSPSDTMSSETVRLYARVLRSADARMLDSAAFTGALASSDPRVRQAAARALAQLAVARRSDVLPQLRLLARDGDTRVASSAVFGLGLAHDTASLGMLTTLARGTTSGDAAAWALGELGPPARDTLSMLLGEATRVLRPPNITSALLLAASKMKPVDVGRVLPLLRARDTTVRWAASYAIARQRSPAAARALLELRTTDAAVLAEVARELTARIAGDSLRAPALARLTVLARASSPYVRINAVRSLGTYGAAARPTLGAALRDRNPLVRVAAAQSVATAFGDERSAWNTAWASDTMFQVRRALLESAASARVRLAGDSMWRVSPHWLLRATALRAWGNSPDSASARLIALAAVRDADGRVRAAAYALLVRREKTARDTAVESALRAAASDPDTLAREELRDEASARPSRPPSNPHPLAWYEELVRTYVVPARPLRAVIATARGPITIALSGVTTPLTVDNFASLAKRRFYDDARFHRVVPGFVAQDGDPRGDGNGGPGYEIRDELTLAPYVRGAVGMALSGPDTGGSQYFLTLTPQPHLDGHYTVFGQVVRGFAAMDALVEGDVISSIRVVQ